MAISRKRPPQVPDAKMLRVIQSIYDDINDVINSINSSELEARDLSKGKSGDIRVIKDSRTSTYRIEAYTEDGWASTNLTISEE